MANQWLSPGVSRLLSRQEELSERFTSSFQAQFGGRWLSGCFEKSFGVDLLESTGLQFTGALEHWIGNRTDM
jgi:hypothetical protein